MTWQLCHADDGSPYYFNSETMESQWNAPPGFAESKSEGVIKSPTQELDKWAQIDRDEERNDLNLAPGNRHLGWKSVAHYFFLLC